MFCGCFAVFCECFAVFPQNTQNTRKTSKNTGKHETLAIHTLVYCGRFQRAQNFDCSAQNTFTKHLRSAKHRKTPQNSHKTRLVKLRRKTPQNKRKTLKTVTKRPQYSRNTYYYHCAHSVYSSKIRWICRESTQYAIYAYITGGGVTYPQGVT